MKLFCDEEPEVGTRIRAVVIDQQEGLLRLEGYYRKSSALSLNEVKAPIKFIETLDNHGYIMDRSSLWEYAP